MDFEAVMFDCDGVLVDSELLGNRIVVECAAEAGVVLSPEEAVARFRGAKMADTVAFIEQRLGSPLPADFTSELRRRMAAAFAAELQPVEGIESVLRGLEVPYCVASNGPRDKMEISLGTTGLLPYFHRRIFSAYEVGSWKPAPDLFLHAARNLGVAPEQCVVVEDSVLGVQAGTAAGMKVLGFAPAEEGPRLAAAGARPFSRMADLLMVLENLALR